MRTLIGQFLRFGVIGVLGFGVDTATVYALWRPLGLYGAGLAAYLVAASFNWAMNRAWTFRGPHAGSPVRQWGRFLAANSVGFVLNRGTYFALIAGSPFCARYPVVAVGAGAVAGMFANFALSRRLVFR